MTLTFNPDGTASCLYSDLIPLTGLGQLTVRRASWIEFNEATQEWEVRLAGPLNAPSFSNPSRTACIAWEHQQLDQ
jgi:hypothetical protein